MSINIVGDIAGQYYALQSLIAKMPPGDLICVGDLCDRGPDSKKVLDLVMKFGTSVLSNHDHMLASIWEGSNYYEPLFWILNGGITTLKSFLPNRWKELDQAYLKAHLQRNTPSLDPTKNEVLNNTFRAYTRMIPKKYINWIKNLPKYIEREGILITHGPVNPNLPFEQTLMLGHVFSSPQSLTSILWNRELPRRNKRLALQVSGHNPYRSVNWFKDQYGLFGVGIDTSASAVLTGINLPSMKIYQHQYL